MVEMLRENWKQIQDELKEWELTLSALGDSRFFTENIELRQQVNQLV